MIKKQTDLLDNWAVRMNNSMHITYSINNRWIYSWKDDDDYMSETDYAILDGFIQELLEATATRTRQEDIRVLESIKKGGECYRFNKDRYALKCTCNNCYHLNEAIQKLNSLK